MAKKTKRTATAPVRTVELPPVSTGVSFIGMLLLVAAVSCLTAASAMRNSIYHTPVMLWKSVVTVSPDKRRAHENYGQALSTAGMYNEALKQFNTVLALHDDGSVPLRDVYRELGVVYFRIGLIDESVQAWQNGLRYAPMDSGLLNNISIAMLRQNRREEAQAYAMQAAAANPYMAEPLNTLGEIYLSLKQPEKAAEYFMKFLQLRPEDTRGYWNLALALEQAGKHEQAYQYATRFVSIERDPRYRQMAQQLLAKIQQSMKSGK